MAKQGYYYLKLKENFFDNDEMKVLESMENGYLYSNILLKLYLKALKNEGKLTFNDYIPYDAKMLATITGHNIDVVEKAVKVFQALHLIEILDNGTIYMLDMQKMIGSISSEGVRKAEYREKIKNEKQIGTNKGQCPDIIYISNSNSSNNINNEKKELPSKTSNSQNSFTNNGSSTKENDKNDDLATSLSLVETPESKSNNTGLKAKEKENYILELFEKTWLIYPHKTGKEQAKKTWSKKFNGLNTKELIREKALKIYALLENHIASWKKEVDSKGKVGRPKQFIPHFSSWLNNEIPDKR